MFHALSQCRQHGFSSCPIPAADIKATLDIYGIENVDERVWHFNVIKAMDAEWLRHEAETMKEKSKERRAPIGRGRSKKS